MDRIKWTDQLIEEKIQDAMCGIGINRMPSKQELESFYGDSALTNKIAKTGGFYHWANALGIEIKQSETFTGYTVENEVKKMLENMGFMCELTGIRHPYDILVNGCVKVDVKSARKSKVRGSDVLSFGLAKPKPTCDIYIAACLNDSNTIEKIYVIPAHIMAGKTQLCLGIHHSKYDCYIDRWDIVKAYEMAFTEIC